MLVPIVVQTDCFIISARLAALQGTGEERYNVATYSTSALRDLKQRNVDLKVRPSLLTPAGGRAGECGTAETNFPVYDFELHARAGEAT